MLQYFQRIAQTLAFRIFLGLLVVSFVFLWGAGDLWQQFMNPANETLVSVGRRKIKMETFGKKLQRQMEIVQRMSGTKRLTPEDYRRMGLEVRVLQELVIGALVDQECARLGIVVPPAAVVRMIHRDATFHGENGVFDRARFNRVLQMLRMGENEYIEMMQGEVARQQVMSILFVGMRAPDVLVDTFLKRFHQNMTVRILEVPLLPLGLPGAKPSTQNATTVPYPTDEALAAFYATNKDYYAIPERRSFTVIYLAYDQLPNTISDTQLKEAFDSRVGKNVKVKFAQVKDELRAQLLREANAKEMEQVKTFVDDRVAGGASLDVVASEATAKFAEFFSKKPLKAHTIKHVAKNGRMGLNGEKSVVAHLSTVVKANIRDHQEIVKLAFVTDNGKESATLQLPSGNLAVVHVSAVNARRIPAFAEVKAKITDVVSRDAQFKATYDKVKVHTDKLLAITDAHKRPLLTSFMGGKIREVSAKRYELASQSKKYALTGFENRADDVNQGDIVLLPNLQSNTLQVLQIKTVRSADTTAVKPEIRTQLMSGLTKEIREDIQQAYIGNLQKRYKVDYNKKALQKLGLGMGK